MSSSTPGSDPNHPQAGTPQGQSDWNAPQQGYGQQYPPPQGYGQQGPPAYGQEQYGQQGHGYQGHEPAPTYSTHPAPSGRRPGMATAAGIVGIVWGGLALLFGLLALTVAFALSALLGLMALASIALAGALLWGGVQVVQDKSPRLLLLVSYVAIGINLLSMVIGLVQGAAISNYLLGFLVPGVVVFLLLHPKTKQYYASRGIGY